MSGATTGAKIDRDGLTEIVDDSRCGKDPRKLGSGLLQAAGLAPRPLSAVIRAKCVDCCAGSEAEVRRCPAVSCALWPYRMRKNPFRVVSEAQREAARLRFGRGAASDEAEDEEAESDGDDLWA